MRELASSLVDKKVLPKVYSKVVEAKQYITNAEAASTSEVARTVGISRGALYKYKDSVYPYQPEIINRVLTVQAVLYNRPGVLVSLVSEFYGAGANILATNQNIPVSGKAMAPISARINNMMGTIDELLVLFWNVDGVCNIDNTTDRQRIESISF